MSAALALLAGVLAALLQLAGSLKTAAPLAATALVAAAVLLRGPLRPLPAPAE